MFRHVVLFRWTDDATEPEIRRYQFGRDAGLMDDNFDFAIVADFDSREDWRVYWEHPEHVRIIQETLRPVIAGRVAAQYEFGE